MLPLKNAAGFTLTWSDYGTGITKKRILITGHTNLTFHFGPTSGRWDKRASAYGFETQWKIVADYGLFIDASDVVVVTDMGGNTVSNLQFYEVVGRDDYPSLYLPHSIYYLKRHD